MEKDNEISKDEAIEPKRVIEEEGATISVFEDRLVIDEAVPATVKVTELDKASLEARGLELRAEIGRMNEAVATFNAELAIINKQLEYFN